MPPKTRTRRHRRHRRRTTATPTPEPTPAEQRAELLEGLAELVRQCDAMRAGIASGDPIAMLEAADFVRVTRPFDAAIRAALAEQNARELNACIDGVFTERGFVASSSDAGVAYRTREGKWTED